MQGCWGKWENYRLSNIHGCCENENYSLWDATVLYIIMMWSRKYQQLLSNWQKKKKKKKAQFIVMWLLTATSVSHLEQPASCIIFLTAMKILWIITRFKLECNSIMLLQIIHHNSGNKKWHIKKIASNTKLYDIIQNCINSTEFFIMEFFLIQWVMKQGSGTEIQENRAVIRELQ